MAVIDFSDQPDIVPGEYREDRFHDIEQKVLHVNDDEKPMMVTAYKTVVHFVNIPVKARNYVQAKKYFDVAYQMRLDLGLRGLSNSAVLFSATQRATQHDLVLHELLLVYKEICEEEVTFKEDDQFEVTQVRDEASDVVFIYKEE
jgi:hypothetical protein